MMKNRAELNKLFSKILDICFEIHTQYGPGMLESFYESVLCYELEKAGINFMRQVGGEGSSRRKRYGTWVSN